MQGEAVPGEPRATLIFTEDQVNGVAFCNSYFDECAREDNEIEVGPLVQTEKFCMEPEGVMALERDFLQALSSGRYIRDGGRWAGRVRC
ncbi:MAG: META domain-containing protein [Anaerolineae bacterium]|nr:META domain-containing protein [Anaerolineae bacterium]